MLKTGETRTDLDGRGEIVFAPERVAYDRRLTLEVEVTDPSSRSVSGRGSAIIGRGLFTVSVRATVGLLRASDPVPVEVLTRDHAGKPVAAAVTVDLDQDVWNPLERRTTRSSRPLASATVTTDALGRAVLSLAPSPARAGLLTLRARADDAKGNRITAEATVWVFDRRMTEYAYRYPALEAFADRERYKPGDTARVLVNTDVKDADVLATVEGRDLYDQRVIGLSGHSGLIEIPIRAAWAPNAFVSLHVRKGKEVHSRTLELPIDAERHDLAISLSPDRGQYAPGDSARIDVETRDPRGRPVPAEVSVAVVDEAIFAIAFGGVDKTGRSEVRKDFRDVALWAPAVLTGSDGRGRVALRYPDNLTTWRITSRGATDRTLVGKAVAKTLVTKQLVARLAPPRFFVAGDEASLVSVVTNRDPAPFTGVEGSIEVAGAAALAGAASSRFDLPARGESRGLWSVRIPPEPPREGEDARFIFRARSKTDADALETRVPIKARRAPARCWRSASPRA